MPHLPLLRPLSLALCLALTTALSAALPPPTTTRPNTVEGWAATSAGAPLAGATVSIYGTTMAGQNTRFEVKTGRDGHYRQRVPEGIYGVRAEYVVAHGDRNFTVALDPLDGITAKSHDSADGIGKDFVWRISGLHPGATAGEPGTYNEPFKYYGGSLQVEVQQDGFATEPPLPAGATLIARLVPTGTLLDGTTGKPLEFRRTFDHRNRSTAYWYPSDIPLGRYEVTMSVEQPGQAARDLTLRKSGAVDAAFVPSLTLDFLPSSSSGASLPIQVTVTP